MVRREHKPASLFYHRTANASPKEQRRFQKLSLMTHPNTHSQTYIQGYLEPLLVLLLHTTTTTWHTMSSIKAGMLKPSVPLFTMQFVLLNLVLSCDCLLDCFLQKHSHVTKITFLKHYGKFMILQSLRFYVKLIFENC